jgi:hypothetical protein
MFNLQIQFHLYSNNSLSMLNIQPKNYPSKKQVRINIKNSCLLTNFMKRKVGRKKIKSKF